MYAIELPVSALTRLRDRIPRDSDPIIAFEKDFFPPTKYGAMEKHIMISFPCCDCDFSLDEIVGQPQTRIGQLLDAKASIGPRDPPKSQ